MKTQLIKKSSILLLVIIGIGLALMISIVMMLRLDSVTKLIRSDRPINILFVFEEDGKPASTQLLMFYPSKGKASLLDVPGNTAVILKTIKRMDRIDISYKPDNPSNYITEVSKFLDVNISGWIVFREKKLVKAVDLLDGLQVFIPSMVVQLGNPPIRLPGGAVTLDGDKVLQYLDYREEGESEMDVLGRRQKLATALFKRISEKAGYLANPEVMSQFVRATDSNLSFEARKRLFVELAKLNVDKMMLQHITGTYRTVDGQSLLFPYYDGELVRDIVKQTLNALSMAGTAQTSSKIFTVEVLNGTTEKGLAARTADIFSSFGYDVVSVGNANKLDYKNTVIIDRYGDKSALNALADVIQCRNLADSATYNSSIQADFTIILGKDFDGRFCVR
jgi:anionic cell wall polymer biosynthesis LytR-Cps2A-Psr (LCP) family protein